MVIPATTTGQSPPDDLSLALIAAKAAAEAAAAARDDAPLRARAKSVSADLVTDADAKAEAAAVAVLGAHRPDDAIVGEEGTAETGVGARRWWIDGIDGTVAFASGIPSWCSAVVLEDEHGPKATAVFDPAAQEVHTAARGQGAFCNGRASRVRTTGSLLEAHVAVFLRQDRLVKPGVRESAHRILDQSGLIRHAGPGTLELAWVAAGRLDAWIQPDTDPWDWHPGALLVTEAGGEARVVQRQSRWHIAGSSTLVDALVALLT
jgi:myo-inositol-1(or 4)-monophosphatase